MKKASLGLPLQSKNTKWSHIELLELIDEYGSINKAASTMGGALSTHIVVYESVKS